jgi:hypothetical protein
MHFYVNVSLYQRSQSTCILNINALIYWRRNTVAALVHTLYTSVYAVRYTILCLSCVSTMALPDEHEAADMGTIISIFHHTLFSTMAPHSIRLGTKSIHTWECEVSTPPWNSVMLFRGPDTRFSASGFFHQTTPPSPLIHKTTPS